MKKPNFLLVGANKSGSSSLSKYLRQHPDIFLSPVKEPLFFIREEVVDRFPDHEPAVKREGILSKLPRTASEYYALFSEAGQEGAIGECSASYLYYHHDAIPNIIRHLGRDVKILIILRNPVDKAFSQYTHLKRLGAVQSSFEDELAREERRIAAGFSYLFHFRKHGLYFHQVRAYLEHFPQVKIMLTEELSASPGPTLAAIGSFLGVDPHFTYDTSKRYNTSAVVPKNYRLHRMVNHHAVRTAKRWLSQVPLFHPVRRAAREVYRRNNVDSTVLNPETRRALTSYFEPDIRRLEALIGRDLAHWYAPQRTGQQARVSVTREQ